MYHTFRTIPMTTSLYSQLNFLKYRVDIHYITILSRAGDTLQFKDY